MPYNKTRTAAYSAEARKRLGEAVIAAREDAGFPTRASFQRWANIKSTRSMDMVENGEPGVGQAILSAIARALPGWTEDTPRIILEGGPAPTPPTDEDMRASLPAELAEGYEAETIFMDPDRVGTDEWLTAATELLDGDALREALRFGLERRKGRRELQGFLQQLAERIRPNGNRGEKSRVD